MEAEPAGVGSPLELLDEQALSPEIASTAVAAMVANLMEVRMKVPLFVYERIPHCGRREPCSESAHAWRGVYRSPGLHFCFLKAETS